MTTLEILSAVHRVQQMLESRHEIEKADVLLSILREPNFRGEGPSGPGGSPSSTSRSSTSSMSTSSGRGGVLEQDKPEYRTSYSVRPETFSPKSMQCLDAMRNSTSNRLASSVSASEHSSHEEAGSSFRHDTQQDAPQLTNIGSTQPYLREYNDGETAFRRESSQRVASRSHRLNNSSRRGNGSFNRGNAAQDHWRAEVKKRVEEVELDVQTQGKFFSAKIEGVEKTVAEHRLLAEETNKTLEMKIHALFKEQTDTRQELHDHMKASQDIFKDLFLAQQNNVEEQKVRRLDDDQKIQLLTADREYLMKEFYALRDHVYNKQNQMPDEMSNSATPFGSMCTAPTTVASDGSAQARSAQARSAQARSALHVLSSSIEQDMPEIERYEGDQAHRTSTSSESEPVTRFDSALKYFGMYDDYYGVQSAATLPRHSSSEMTPARTQGMTERLSRATACIDL